MIGHTALWSNETGREANQRVAGKKATKKSQGAVEDWGRIKPDTFLTDPVLFDKHGHIFTSGYRLSVGSLGAPAHMSVDWRASVRFT